jgi:hypothetical protein
MYQNDHIRDLEMGRTCSMHREAGKCISSSWEPEGKRKLWRSVPLSEDDIKMSHKKERQGSVNRIHVGSQGRVLWWAAVQNS